MPSLPVLRTSASLPDKVFALKAAIEGAGFIHIENPSILKRADRHQVGRCVEDFPEPVLALLQAFSNYPHLSLNFSSSATLRRSCPNSSPFMTLPPRFYCSVLALRECCDFQIKSTELIRRADPRGQGQSTFAETRPLVLGTLYPGLLQICPGERSAVADSLRPPRSGIRHRH